MRVQEILNRPWQKWRIVVSRHYYMRFEAGYEEIQLKNESHKICDSFVQGFLAVVGRENERREPGDRKPVDSYGY